MWCMQLSQGFMEPIMYFRNCFMTNLIVRIQYTWRCCPTCSNNFLPSLYDVFLRFHLFRQSLCLHNSISQTILYNRSVSRTPISRKYMLPNCVLLSWMACHLDGRNNGIFQSLRLYRNGFIRKSTLSPPFYLDFNLNIRKRFWMVELLGLCKGHLEND